MQRGRSSGGVRHSRAALPLQRQLHRPRVGYHPGGLGDGRLRLCRERQRLFDALAQGGRMYMPLDDYGFGPFGWVEDRFGVSWQLAAPAAENEAQ